MAPARRHLPDFEIAGDVLPLGSNDQAPSQRNQQPRRLANHRVSPLTLCCLLTVGGAAAMSGACGNSPPPLPRAKPTVTPRSPLTMATGRDEPIRTARRP